MSHRIKISEKVKGDLFVGKSANPLKGGKIYDLSDNEYNNSYIQTLLRKGFATDYEEIEDSSENIVIDTIDTIENDNVFDFEEKVENDEEDFIEIVKAEKKEHKNTTDMITWDAENQTLLNKEASTKKSLLDRKGVELTLSVDGEEQYNDTLNLNEETRRSFKKEKTTKLSQTKIKKLSKKNNIKLASEDELENIPEMIDLENGTKKIKKALSKKKMSKSEKLKQMKKYLVLDDDEIDNLDRKIKND